MICNNAASLAPLVREHHNPTILLYTAISCPLCGFHGFYLIQNVFVKIRHCICVNLGPFRRVLAYPK